MQFSEALNQLKQGLQVSRRGWNGKGMFVYLVEGQEYPAQTDVAAKHFRSHPINTGSNSDVNTEKIMVPYRSYLAMKTVDDEVVPWVASQTDLLAEDWFLVKDEE